MQTRVCVVGEPGTHSRTLVHHTSASPKCSVLSDPQKMERGMTARDLELKRGRVYEYGLAPGLPRPLSQGGARAAGPSRARLARAHGARVARDGVPCRHLPLRPAAGARVGKGMAYIARHVIGCHFTPDTRVICELDDVAVRGPGRYYSPRHPMPMPFNSRNKGSKCVGSRE